MKEVAMMGVFSMRVFFMIFLVLGIVLSTSAMLPPPPDKSQFSPYMTYVNEMLPGISDDDEGGVFDSDDAYAPIMNQFINQA